MGWYQNIHRNNVTTEGLSDKRRLLWLVYLLSRAGEEIALTYTRVDLNLADNLWY